MNTRIINAIKQAKEDYRLKGGSGSGNFGHSGRPGKIGGSAGGTAVDIGFMRIIGASPNQLATIEQFVKSIPAWHTQLVNAKVMNDILQQYRHLPNYADFDANTRKLTQTGKLTIEFENGAAASRTDPLTGKIVQGVGSHIPNSIKLSNSLKDDALKDVLAHELGHQVSNLASKLTPIAKLKWGKSYTSAGENMEAARLGDRKELEHILGVSGAGSERYQRWSNGLKMLNSTTDKSYNPVVNMEERFAEAYRLHVTGQSDKLTPRVARYIAKFFNKKPPAGSVGVD